MHRRSRLTTAEPGRRVLPGLGPEGVQCVRGTRLPGLWSKAQLRGALGVVEQQVLQDRHPDLLQPGALGDLVRCQRVRDVELVQLAAGPGLDLGPPDVQFEVLQGPYLQNRLSFFRACIRRAGRGSSDPVSAGNQAE